MANDGWAMGMRHPSASDLRSDPHQPLAINHQPFIIAQRPSTIRPPYLRLCAFIGSSSFPCTAGGPGCERCFGQTDTEIENAKARRERKRESKRDKGTGG